MTTLAAELQPRFMSNLKLFSSRLEDTKSGGLLVRDVLILGEGKWHASNWPWPVYYSPSELEKATVSDRSLWDGHQNKAPSGKVGHFLNHHYDSKLKGVVADVFLHGHSSKSRDLIEMVKAGTSGEIDSLWVSVEHTSNDFYNKELDQYEARDIDIMGLAVVDSGACRTCKLNEDNTDSSKGMDLAELKELEASLEAVRKELAEARAVKYATPADVESIVKENKALQETVKALGERLEKLEKQPAPARTTVTAAEPELIMLE